jgi:hypothetical protein
MNNIILCSEHPLSFIHRIKKYDHMKCALDGLDKLQCVVLNIYPQFVDFF